MAAKSKFYGEGLTFDDVLLVPAYSEVLPREVNITTRLTPEISLNLPLVSAAMDTVTEANLAIALAREGGIGMLHKNMSIAKQAEQVRKVKRSESGLIVDPITLLPDAFDADALALETANGGGRERFALASETVEHGAPVSFLVSSSHGLGMTEGWAAIGDGRTGLRVTVDRATAPLLGMLSHRKAGGRLFCQLQLSALELDDTSKPGAYATGPRRFRFSIEAV